MVVLQVPLGVEGLEASGYSWIWTMSESGFFDFEIRGERDGRKRKLMTSERNSNENRKDAFKK